MTDTHHTTLLLEMLGLLLAQGRRFGGFVAAARIAIDPLEADCHHDHCGNGEVIHWASSCAAGLSSAREKMGAERFSAFCDLNLGIGGSAADVAPYLDAWRAKHPVDCPCGHCHCGTHEKATW